MEVASNTDLLVRLPAIYSREGEFRENPPRWSSPKSSETHFLAQVVFQELLPVLAKRDRHRMIEFRCSTQ